MLRNLVAACAVIQIVMPCGARSIARLRITMFTAALELR
jgi:hypothetical protein